MEHMEIKDRIIELRKQRDLTQAETAVKAGISIRAYQNYESGRKPKNEYLKKIADALDVPEEALLSDEAFNKYWKEYNKNKLIKNTFTAGSAGLIGTLGLGALSTGIATTSILTSVGLVALAPIIPIAGIATSILFTKKKEDTRLLYQLISRFQIVTDNFNQRFSNNQNAYEQLAIKTQQEDATDEDFENFFHAREYYSFLQDYGSLLKRKELYISNLIDEIKAHPGKRTQLLEKLIEVIEDIENQEKEYLDMFSKMKEKYENK